MFRSRSAWMWLRIFSSFIVLVAASLAAPAWATEWVFPRTGSKALFQTNGPKANIDNGDWWTNENNGIGSQPHLYELYVPATVDSLFTIHLEIYDPECYLTHLDLDQKSGVAWDDVVFTLYNPKGDRIVKQQTFNPLPGTSCVWVPFAAFTAKEYGYGVYRLQVVTATDDKNSYALKIVNNDPDGVPGSGDEIHIAALQTAIHYLSSHLACMSFYVSGNQPLVLANFDADRDSTWAYFTPQGDSLPGTPSDDGVWNDGSISLPPPGGDWYENPEPGWWQVRTFKKYGNQFTFYCAKPFLLDTTLAFPDLEINTDDGIITAAPEKQITWQINVHNQGQGPALAVTVCDTLCKGMNLLQASAGATVTNPNGQTVLSWNFARLKPGEMIRLFVTAQISSPTKQYIENKTTAKYTDVLYTLYDRETASDRDMLYLPGMISGWIWRDQNYDGVMAASEPGLANIIITLYNSHNDTVAVTTSAQNGSYQFTGLAVEEYHLVINESSLPFNMNQTVTELPGSLKITAAGEHFDSINFGYEMGMTPVEVTYFDYQATANGIRLFWMTGSETNNLGFNILRSNAENGEYVTMNDQIIPGAGNMAQEKKYEFIDRSAQSGQTYYYKLMDVDYQGRGSYHGPIAASVQQVPEAYSLEQNYPNPFNGETVIAFHLKQSGYVDVSIFNVLGQKVKTLASQQMDAGSFSIKWDGSNEQGMMVQSGIYFYVLQTSEFRQVKKMQMIK
jgi:uncharacterized repeat protein (TIGR01451 family)